MYLLPGLACLYRLKLVLRRMRLRIGEHFDDCRILQRRRKRNNFSVSLSPHDFFAHAGMYCVCKVDCVCACRKLYDVALWSKDKYFIAKQFVFEFIKK